MGNSSSKDDDEDGEKEKEEEIEYSTYDKMKASLFQCRVCCGIGWLPVLPGLVMMTYGLITNDEAFLWCGVFFVACFGALFVFPSTICGCCYLHFRSQFNKARVTPEDEKHMLP